jgi:lipoprotein-anchoring transpeptidase ErfK/SrfK
MPALSRRAILRGAFVIGTGMGVGSCASSRESSQLEPSVDAASESRFGGMYGELSDRFPVPAVKLSDINPIYLRQSVTYAKSDMPGTIVVDPSDYHLYFVQPGGQAVRYGVGVGGEGFGWSGLATVHDKQEWPDWYPPKEMIQRVPEIEKELSQLRGGLGVPGGPRNPLGARAMYLWQGNKDTLYRIHGTLEPWTIGQSISSGCIRMINQDAIDLYQRTSVGTKVVVLPTRNG